MGDVIPMVKKSKGGKDKSSDGTELRFENEFCNGFITIGFNENYKPFFAISKLSLMEVNWLLDRMKHGILTEEDELEGVILTEEPVEKT